VLQVGFTLIAQITVADLATATAALFCIAIVALATVGNLPAAGMGVPAKHQQHCNDYSHNTLPWFAGSSLALGLIRSEIAL
jgi:hypothetical protein